jgi:hypothetical protein
MPWHRSVLVLVNTRAAGGAVRQLGEFSADGGATWIPSFDFLYRPAASGGD